MTTIRPSGRSRRPPSFRARRGPEPTREEVALYLATDNDPRTEDVAREAATLLRAELGGTPRIGELAGGVFRMLEERT